MSRKTRQLGARRTVPLWAVLVALAAFLVALWALDAAIRRWQEPDPGMDETGGAAIYLPTVAAPYRWPECRSVLDVYEAWQCAGLVTEQLRAPYIVGFDLAVPDSCLPFVRYRAAGRADRGEVYLCADRADIGALRTARGAGRWVYACGGWLLTVPTAYPADVADRLAGVIVDACTRGVGNGP